MSSHHFAVVGNPVAHSRSPEIHQRFAEQFGLKINYERILGDVDNFPITIGKMLDTGITGFNVTVPFKQQAWKLCDSCGDEAAKVQAVNTVIVKNEKLIGYNTDGIGLVRDITQNLDWNISNTRVLVLGAGGAVKGVLPEILNQNPREVVVVNRTKEKADNIVAGIGSSVLNSVAENELSGEFDLIINGTSAGLSGNVPKIPTAVVGTVTRCYDMVYGAGITSFNEWAKGLGSNECADGLGMLVEQAAKAFSIWTGRDPDTSRVIPELRKLIRS